jgi:DeoR family glycerol-3-phosphate regulon repressor
MLEYRDEKQKIALKVVSLVKDGDSLMLDAGSTTAYIAQALCVKKNLTVITNSAQIASILAPITGNRIFMAGSELRSHDTAAFGVNALNVFKQFDVKFAILSVTAIHDQRGFMVQQQFEAELSRMLMERADVSIFAADHSKFGQKALVQVCPPNQVDMLITDASPPDKVIHSFQGWGVDIILA